MTHPVADLLVGDRGPGPQHPRLLDRPAEVGHVAPEDVGVDQVVEDIHLVVGEALDQPEVQEGDPAARLEQVVARVGVTVEGVQPIERAEDEAEDGLPRQVLLLLAPGLQLLPAGTGGELSGQDPAGGELVDHLGDPDEGMVAVVLDEELLVGGLGPVVQFLDQALLELGDQRVGVEAGEHEPGGTEQDIHVVQVGLDRLVHPRVLDLDRHGPVVVGDGLVDLADRGRRQRNGVPFGEQLLGALAELGHQDPGGQLGAHGRGVLAQVGQGGAHGRGQSLVEVAGHLTELHHRPLEVPELGRHLLGRTKGEGLVQHLLSFGRREHRAGPVGGIGPAGAGPELGESGGPGRSSRRAEVHGPDLGRSAPDEGHARYGGGGDPGQDQRGAELHLTTLRSGTPSTPILRRLPSAADGR